MPDPAPSAVPAPAAPAAAAVTQPTRAGLAFIAGLGAAVVGAVLWALITVTTKYQIGFMAVGVGLLVGWTVQRTGRSGAPVLGVLGAALALGGCPLGDLLSAAPFIAEGKGVPLMSAVGEVLTNPSLDVAILTATFDVMQIVFYAIAIYEGYKFARRPVSG